MQVEQSAQSQAGNMEPVTSAAGVGGQQRREDAGVLSKQAEPGSRRRSDRVHLRCVQSREEETASENCQVTEM